MFKYLVILQFLLTGSLFAQDQNWFTRYQQNQIESINSKRQLPNIWLNPQNSTRDISRILFANNTKIERIHDFKIRSAAELKIKPGQMLQQQLNGRNVFRSGTNIGGGKVAEDLVQWSQNNLNIMRSQRASAARLVNRTGEYSRGVRKLVQGLHYALASDPNLQSNSTFTKLMLERSVEFVTAMDLQHPSYSEETHYFNYVVLQSLYDLIINKVAQDLDFNFYIPYVESRYNAEKFKPEQLEKRILKFAVMQIHWLNKNLASATLFNGSDLHITPSGNKLQNSWPFLIATEYLSSHIAKDLQDSLWRYRFACAAGSLLDLNQILSGFNQGDTSEFIDDQMAVSETFLRLDFISAQITSAQSCSFNTRRKQ